jgi:hypothetical protein
MQCLCVFVACCIVGPSAAPEALALCFASMVCIAPPPLSPRAEAHGPWPLRTTRAVAGAGAVGVVVAIGTDLGIERIAQLALGVAALVLATDACRAWFRHRLDASAASAWTTALLVASFALPLILGPLAEANAERRWLVAAVVAASPLSHLASQLDYDYLRAPWFYRHSELGALRFEYPSPFVTTAVLLGIAAISEGARRRLFTHERIPPPCTACSHSS